MIGKVRYSFGKYYSRSRFYRVLGKYFLASGSRFPSGKYFMRY